jgi:hypothetical protein
LRFSPVLLLEIFHPRTKLGGQLCLFSTPFVQRNQTVLFHTPTREEDTPARDGTSKKKKKTPEIKPSCSSVQIFLQDNKPSKLQLTEKIFIVAVLVT